MQSVYEPVPFAIGGVAHPRPQPITSADGPARFGSQDSRGFRPMFFDRDLQQSEAEAQLRLDWEQAAAQQIAQAYARVAAPDEERHFDIPA